MLGRSLQIADGFVHVKLGCGLARSFNTVAAANRQCGSVHAVINPQRPIAIYRDTTARVLLN